MTINPTADEKFALFDTDDRQFLARIASKHPKIIENFDKYLGFPASLRFPMAKVEVMDIARTGWVLKGIKDPESVYDHLHGLSSLVDNYLSRFLPHLNGEDRETTIRMGRRMQGMAKVHDIPEAIASDFTHHDHTSGKISSADKQRLELLAARVIFEDKPELMTLYQEFHEQKSAASQLLHDLDKIHAVVGCIFYEAKYPEKTNLWPEFYPYTKSKIKTDAGRNFLETIARDKEAHIAMLRNPTAKDEVRSR